MGWGSTSDDTPVRYTVVRGLFAFQVKKWRLHNCGGATQPRQLQQYSKKKIISFVVSKIAMGLFALHILVLPDLSQCSGPMFCVQHSRGVR